MQEVSEKKSIKEVMSELRAKLLVEGVLSDNLEGVVPFKRSVANFDSGEDIKAGDLRDSLNLRYLNLHHARSFGVSGANLKSHRKGLIGKLVTKVKQRMLVWLGDILRDHQQQEIEYRANLVRYLNQVAGYVDSRDSGIFWELIHKIDTDITGAIARIEAIHTEGEASIANVQQSMRDLVYNEVVKIREQSDHYEVRIAIVERVLEGVERILASLQGRGFLKAGVSDHKEMQKSDETLGLANTAPVGFEAIEDLSYLLFENRFRGTEDLIRERVGRYVAEFQSRSLDNILDIGCGRGELLDALKVGGLSAQGVDFDLSMINRCQDKGLSVQQCDGLQYLANLGSGVLGGVVAVQVVEHLRVDQLKELIRLCAGKVRKGGIVIFETINPQSLVALSSNYFRDPTHVAPLHPDTLAYLMQLGGLANPQVSFLSPFASSENLPAIENEEFFSPRWQRVIRILNAQTAQLNKLLYGYQDYCIVAEVP